MNISLTRELEQYVHDKVSSGLYTSASEVVRTSLRLMHAQEGLQTQRISQLNQAIDIGLEQLAKGQKVEGSVSYEKMKNKIKKAAKARA
jgi:antitoxin ParD1/3/4